MEFNKFIKLIKQMYLDNLKIYVKLAKQGWITMIKNLIEITTLRDKLQKFKRQLKTIISNRKNVSIEQYTSKLSNLYNQLKSFEDENVDNINKYSDIHSMLFGLYHKIDNEQAKYYINECAKILPDYYPIQILKNEIEEKQI